MSYYTPPTPPRQRSKTPWIIGGCLLLLLCLACSAALFFSGIIVAGSEVLARIEATETALAFRPTETAISLPPATPFPGSTPTPPPTLAGAPETNTATAAAPPTPTETPKPDILLNLNPPAEIEQRLLPARALEHINALLAAHFPSHDYFESAVRLGGFDLGERTITAAPYNLGDRQTFSTEENLVEAELLAITEHTYFWFEVGLDVTQTQAQTVADRFETTYYQPVIDLFGEEWRPGVDNDPHFSVLHLAEFEDSGELGYFDSGDEYPESISNGSNEQEIIYLNLDSLEFGRELYLGTLVHEVQHLTQWNADANETAWLNEGLSQLAELYVGLDTVNTHFDYLDSPETQLNTWNYDDDDAVFAHYGGAFLFSTYIWEQLGEDAIRDLAAHPANGEAAVYAILAGYAPDRPLNEFVGDWAVANYLNNTAAGDQFAYRNINLSQPPTRIEVSSPPFDTVRTIAQYSTDYVRLNTPGEITISFVGDSRLPLLDAEPHSGEQMWLTPAIDELDARLTAAFDLSGLNSAQLEFWAWYDLEEDFDFAYLSISNDGGNSWRLLPPDHATPGEYGPAFNGRSQDESDQENGWVPESISLNSYLGQEVLIRFEVLTDPALTGQGFAIDDIAIPQLGYQSDVENGADGWQASGFVQSGSILPQQWSLRVIQNGAPPQVTPLYVNELNRGQWTVTFNDQGGILVITALTPFTTTPASYWLAID